jgi:hypothetical protein
MMAHAHLAQLIVDEEDLRDAMRRVREYRKDKREQSKVAPVSKRLQ